MRRYPDEPVEWYYHRSGHVTFILIIIGHGLSVICADYTRESYLQSEIVCGESYPDQPPLSQFISRVNLPFVNQQDGKVDPGKIAVLGH